MSKLIYAPKALEDLQGIKAYISKQFGEDRAKSCIQEITTTVRQLKMFPDEGVCLEEMIECPTDYHYLVVKSNYIFYRIENETVRIVRVLNERQDFLQTLFGISSISKEGENYWGE